MKLRILELDGIRGLAILLVLVGHYGSYVVPGVELFALASLGVNVFFVLSGFLIGGILLDESGERGFLASFYRRRAARILPIYFTVVALAFAAQSLVAGEPWSDRLLAPWVYLLFLTNFALAELGRTGLLLNPTWSLAVEEQFYLAMPFVILATPRRMLAAVLGALCVVAVGLRWAWSSDIAAVEVLLVCRMDSLLVGVLAALLHRNANLRPHAQSLLAFALVPLVAMLILNRVEHEAAAVIAPTAFAVTTAFLMLSSIHGAAVGGALRVSWLRFLGEISYGLYLIHEPCRILLTGVLLDKTVFDPGLDRVPVSILALVVAIAVATVSWRRFERPIIEWSRRRADQSQAAREQVRTDQAVTAASTRKSG